MANEQTSAEIDPATIERIIADNRLEIVESIGEVVSLLREQNRLLEKIYQKVR